MGLTTHVLDTCHGRPAAGLRVTLWRQNDADGWQALRTVVLNADGRNPDGPLLSTRELTPGRYRLEFEVATYFRAQGLALPDPPFLDRVTIDFGVADADAHYHVPLLVSPWSYATYRGS
ncbi:MAG: hydroxyisourate hydrolase [Tepidimonas sp.]|uniref:hydroxyisourate hydrolase n=1 Tax=Tepidimonas sp. TaxID=2002775 RepID=UPI00298F2D89|nr:hydroxyisourate hydrolase [Tepidimonas sp.]MCS6811878.1 hydroxyisourate hydrolase [Tepidimonas sp.]MDW8335733.1 hydroxyisourate hydrolase [Tepidimonas sp.]